MGLFTNDTELASLKEDVINLKRQVQGILERIETPADAEPMEVGSATAGETEPEQTAESAVETSETPVTPETPVTSETPATEKPVETVVPQEAVASCDCCKQLEELKAQVAKLAEAVDNAAYQERMVKELHLELQQYKKGFLEDLTKGYLADIIQVYERVADTNSHLNPDDETVDVKALKRLLENNMLFISDLLEDQYSIECFTPQPGDDYKPKEQKALKTEATDDPAKANTVAACIACGFRNYETGRIIRQAKIKVYKLSVAPNPQK